MRKHWSCVSLSKESRRKKVNARVDLKRDRKKRVTVIVAITGGKSGVR